MKTLMGMPLFSGCPEESVREVCRLAKARVRRYAVREVVFHECLPAKDLFVVLSGRLVTSICVLAQDQRHLLMSFHPGDVIGSTLVGTGLKTYPEMAEAAEASDVLSLDVAVLRELILRPEYGRLLKNLLAISGCRCMRAVRKLAVMSCYETGDRILLQLRHHFEDTGNRVVHYKSNALANYLGVNRTALYRSIAKLVKAGLIKASRGRLELLAD